jgi:ketosteroid isomerase-like protein
MKNRFRSWLLASAAVGLAASAAADDATEAVLAAQDRRMAATVAADVATLAALMTDDLSYTHSNGIVETKAEFLEALRTGKHVYRSITPDARRVRVYGDVAVVSGPCRITVVPGGTPTEIGLYFTELYFQQNGHWLMALWHSTRLPPAPARP